MILQVLVTFDGRELVMVFCHPKRRGSSTNLQVFMRTFFTMTSLICNHYQSLATKRCSIFPSQKCRLRKMIKPYDDFLSPATPGICLRRIHHILASGQKHRGSKASPSSSLREVQTHGYIPCPTTIFDSLVYEFHQFL